MKIRSPFLAACALALTTLGVSAAEHSAGEIVDDATVTAKVKAALIADPETKAHQISVDTYKGTVKLSGFVDSETARQKAVEVAEGVAGTVAVEDALDVRH